MICYYAYSVASFTEEGTRQPLFMHKSKQTPQCSDQKTVATILRCFAGLVKSNSVLMTDILADENRLNIDFIIQQNSGMVE